MNDRRRKALIADLERLRVEIPTLIDGVLINDEEQCEMALTLVQGASAKQTALLLDRLTNHVITEAWKGNTGPLRMVASGRAFDERNWNRMRNDDDRRT